jgi:hypothetical protein
MSKKDQKNVVINLDPNGTEELTKAQEGDNFLSSILEHLGHFEKSQKNNLDGKIKLSFDFDPNSARQIQSSSVGGMYKPKTDLIPDELLKRIAGVGGDDLVNTIIQARSNHVSMHGRPKESRFDIGFDLVPKDKSKLPQDAEEMAKLMDRVEKVKELIWSCGGKVMGEHEAPTFSQFLKMTTRDGLIYGRLAVTFVNDEKSNKMVAFRAADAGTIYKTAKYKVNDQSFRKDAMKKIKEYYELSGREFDEKQFIKGDYIYAQLINGMVVQLFTADEMIVHNLYPVTNVEYGGYPLTPIDQAIHAITTHINITMHNKLYFQHGRAARGMVVVKSKTVDEQTLHTMRLHFQNSINSVKNSHRMPVFGVGPEDSIDWKPIDNSSRDMEFQYLSDSNARVILGAFQISPDELPGYGHLSRGSNSQALSESNNEYKLSAARDVGLRPLLNDLQDFFNRNILPKIDEDVCKLFALAFSGLDKDNPEKESTRLQQDMNVWMSFNDIMDAVEKDRLPPEMGGDVPLNQQFLQTISPYLTFGEVLEYFFKKKGAAKDPRHQWYNNPMWLQYKQMEQMDVQTRIQMLMSAQQPQPQPGQPGQDQGQPQGQQPEQLQRSEFNADIELKNLKKKFGV